MAKRPSQQPQAQKEPKRQPIDFNHLDVKDRRITDPEGAEMGGALDTEYPKHLHKFFALGQPHEYVEVSDAADEANRRKQGWMGAKEADEVAHAAQRKADAGESTPGAPAAPKKRVRKPAAKKA